MDDAKYIGRRKSAKDVQDALAAAKLTSPPQPQAVSYQMQPGQLFGAQAFGYLPRPDPQFSTLPSGFLQRADQQFNASAHGYLQIPEQPALRTQSTPNPVKVGESSSVPLWMHQQTANSLPLDAQGKVEDSKTVARKQCSKAIKEPKQKMIPATGSNDHFLQMKSATLPATASGVHYLQTASDKFQTAAGVPTAALPMVANGNYLQNDYISGVASATNNMFQQAQSKDFWQQFYDSQMQSMKEREIAEREERERQKRLSLQREREEREREEQARVEQARQQQLCAREEHARQLRALQEHERQQQQHAKEEYERQQRAMAELASRQFQEEYERQQRAKTDIFEEAEGAQVSILNSEDLELQMSAVQEPVVEEDSQPKIGTFPGQATEDIDAQTEPNETPTTKKGGRGGKKKKAKSPVPEDQSKHPKPKKPRNAFLFFKKAFIADASTSNPGSDLIKLTSILAEKWRELDPDEKAKWQRIALDDKFRYAQEMEQYNQLNLAELQEMGIAPSPIAENLDQQAQTPPQKGLVTQQIKQETATPSQQGLVTPQPHHLSSQTPPQVASQTPPFTPPSPKPTSLESMFMPVFKSPEQPAAQSQRITVQNAQEIMGVLEVLCKNPIAVDFLQPVATLFPAVEAQYNKVIKHPMDLGTIVQKLRTGRYNTADRIARHVHRVFENCKKFNSNTNRVFYNRAQHLSDYFDKLWAETSVTSLGIRRRQRLTSHQQAIPIALRGKDLELCVNAVKACGTPLSPLVTEALKKVLSSPQVQYGKFLELVLTMFGYDSTATTLDVIFNKLAPLGDGGILSSETFDQWQRLERVLLSVVGKKMEQIYRGNDFSCVWSIPWRFVWAKTRGKETLWPAMVLIDSKTPDSVAQVNLARIPSTIGETLKRQREKTPNPLLVEFFGTNEFAWVKEEFVERFNGREDHRCSAQGSVARERWEAALYDLELAIAELKKATQEEEELPESLIFTIDASEFQRGFPEPDSEISDHERRKKKRPRARPKNQHADTASKRKKVQTRRKSKKPIYIEKIHAFVDGVVDEDPNFYDCYLFEKVEERRQKATTKLIRKKYLIHRIQQFLIEVLRTDPEFYHVYELQRAAEMKQKRMQQEGEREERGKREMDRKMKLAEKIEALRLRALTPKKSKRRAAPHHKLVKISLEQWNAFQVLNRGKQVKYCEAIEFYANLDPDAVQEKTEFYKELSNGTPNTSAVEEDGDIEGLTDSDDELFGCPDEVESIPTCKERKEYMRNCTNMLWSDIQSLEKLYEEVVNSATKSKKRLMQPKSSLKQANTPSTYRKAPERQTPNDKKSSDTSGADQITPGKVPSKEYRNSRYRGVCFQGNKFISRISIYGKVVTLGRFTNEVEAAKAYDCKAKEVFGSKALVNFASDDDSGGEVPWGS